MEQTEVFGGGESDYMSYHWYLVLCVGQLCVMCFSIVILWYVITLSDLQMMLQRNNFVSEVP